MKNKPISATARTVMLLALLGLGCPSKAGPAAPEPEKKLSVDLGEDVTMEFVLIRPGSFTMGLDKGGFADERPAHKVTLTKPFYLGKHEVTQEQWKLVMKDNPSDFKGAGKPVENVTWDDCQAFVAKLKHKAPGKTFRLPTEAEWEYACRAGGSGEFCYGDGEGRLGEHAWWGGNSRLMSHPVGGKKPNAWGLHDMYGNLWEWCADWYANSYPAGAATDPTGSNSGSDRVSRGGCWGGGGSICRSAFRDWFTPEIRNFFIGFRLAAVPAGL